MFKLPAADPTRRLPVYLQNGTKENLVWQLKLTAVMIAGIWIYETLEEHDVPSRVKSQFKKFKNRF